MKKFNTLAEALLMSVSPQSDAVAPVTGSTECPCQKDQFSQSADEFMNSLSPEPIQPDDNVGEVGDIQSEGDGDSSGAEFECMGEEGMKIKFNGIEVILPRNVADELKAWMGDESEEGSEETSEEGSEEGDEHEAEESPDEEKAEHAEGGSEESEEDDKEETVTEAKKKPPFWMKFKKGKGKDKGKGKFGKKDETKDE